MYKFKYLPHRSRNLFWAKENKKIGHVTIVSSLVYGDSKYPIAIEFAVAFTNPNDQFVKEIGRNIAIDRLLNQDKTYYAKVDIKANRRMYHYEFDDIIFNTLKYSIKTPRWFNPSLI